MSKSLNKKVFPSSLSALSDIPHGATVLFGGFGPCGAAENLMRALKEAGPKDLVVISNNLQGLHYH
jgi:acyl CoA:acetate/3-ketoacid CoA transferase alpha subunit